jgi:hypothetical protein
MTTFAQVQVGSIFYLMPVKPGTNVNPFSGQAQLAYTKVDEVSARSEDGAKARPAATREVWQ